jgi:hypothetical protein
MALSAMHSGEHHWKNKTGRTTDTQCKPLDMIWVPELAPSYSCRRSGQDLRGPKFRRAFSIPRKTFVSASEKRSHSRRFWPGPVIHQSPLVRTQ